MKIMNDYWQFFFAASAGLGLSVFFYAGLYITVTRGLSSQRPALWFFSSFLLRIALVLTGFYFISDGHWQRLIACLSAFMVTGVVIKVWKIMPPTLETKTGKVPEKTAPKRDAHHAT